MDGYLEDTDTVDAWQRYYIRLKDTLTGDIRDIAWDYLSSYGDEFVIFYWTEGNGACDCNRATEFYCDTARADEDFSCGNTQMKLLGIWCDGTQILEAE